MPYKTTMPNPTLPASGPLVLASLLYLGGGLGLSLFGLLAGLRRGKRPGRELVTAGAGLPVTGLAR